MLIPFFGFGAFLPYLQLKFRLSTGFQSNKNEKTEDYRKADLKLRVLFFITIFRLVIPAFFRFTDVTELM